MLVRQGRVAELDGADQVLIENAVARTADTDAVVAALPPRLTAGASIRTFAHAAALISPSSVDELVTGLRARGIAVADAVPSDRDQVGPRTRASCLSRSRRTVHRPAGHARHLEKQRREPHAVGGSSTRRGVSRRVCVGLDRWCASKLDHWRVAIGC